MRINDSIRGALILGAVVLVLVIGGFAVADNGWQKVSCIGRAIVGGVAFSNIHSVCGL
ncbi:hypothetical protein SAMN05518865_101293 [Duganella sp. CF458]|uniref:hypothetical protein n=1 Tax=Duganella sp. CF458 TaxID=1884368 RepID=UPI0008EC227D|nr:hypothetical protein [Duganella sp. CF458]SFF53587.1 hypothetical protein SAMN05518865_101293 [Duganella sp. CF458]